MVAATVMVVAISSSLVVLQQGLRAIDTARTTTLAGQILQSQMEKLRLLNWSQLSAVTSATFLPDNAAASTAQMNRFKVAGVGGKCAQSIVDATPFTNMKLITLTATWTGTDGKQHTLSYVTRYAQNGLSDFFYTSH